MKETNVKNVKRFLFFVNRYAFMYKYTWVFITLFCIMMHLLYNVTVHTNRKVIHRLLGGTDNDYLSTRRRDCST